MAWAYREYMTDTDYLRLEGIAKSAKRGLWSHPNPIYPQDFRRSGSSSTIKTKVSTSSQGISNSGGSGSATKTKVNISNQGISNNNSSSGSCSGIKRTCSAMSSCAEARRALQCGCHLLIEIKTVYRARSCADRIKTAVNTLSNHYLKSTLLSAFFILKARQGVLVLG